MDYQIKVLMLLLVLISINHPASMNLPTILLILLLSFNSSIILHVAQWLATCSWKQKIPSLTPASSCVQR